MLWLLINWLKTGFRGRLGWGVVAVGLLLSSGITARGQVRPFQLRRPHVRQATLPLLVERNMPLVELHLNGQGPYRFLLDTGVGVSMITDPALADALHLDRGQPVNIAGLGQDAPLRAYLCAGVRVRLGPAEAPALPMLLLSDDVFDLSAYVGLPVHGILGFDLFQSFVVTLRPRTAELVLHAPDRYRAPRSRRWRRTPLEIEQQRAYVAAAVTQAGSAVDTLRLLLDTGAGHALSLETSSDPRVRLPQLRVKSDLGRGLGGIIHGFMGRVRQIQLAGYALPQVLTSYPDSADVANRVRVARSGNVGFELLRRFDLVIDYPHRQLLLRPNRHYDRPFEQDMTGLELVAIGPELRRYLINSIRTGSPADQAGLCPGDEVLSVNLLPASSFSLSQLAQLFRAQDRRRVLLLVRHPDGELFAAQLTLARTI